jgi:hypothetical protein
VGKKILKQRGASRIFNTFNIYLLLTFRAVYSNVYTIVTCEGTDGSARSVHSTTYLVY